MAVVISDVVMERADVWKIEDASEVEGDKDSGRWSFETEPPQGTDDMSQEETLSAVKIVIAPVETASTFSIPPPPPLPPALLTESLTAFSFFPGASLSDEDFKKAFKSSHNRYSKDCGTCPICYEDKKLDKLNCCSFRVCNHCIESAIKINVIEGRSYIPCLNPDCDKPLTRDFIVRYLKYDENLQLKYERFRLNHERDGSKKTCPNCCMITEKDLPSHNPKRLPPADYNVICEGCSFEWCFNCHSPWHKDVTCEMYRLGDKQFRKWTKHRNAGHVPNCQKCPKCKVFIERSSGCNHMTCNRCHAHFCYQCGGRFSSFPGLGDHYKKLSILGCPYNYHPSEPVARRVIRGGYLFVKGAALTGYPVLLVGGCAVVLVGATVVLPVVGTFALYRYIKRKRRMV